MAINPNFVFADPQLQQAVAQQAIAEAQLRGQSHQYNQAALDRASRERESRAIRQAEIDRANRAQEQQDRQFQQNLGFREKELASNADLYKTYQAEQAKREQDRQKNALDLESYNGLFRQWSDPNNTNLPTTSEAQALMHGMEPDRQQRLLSVLDSNRNRLSNFAKDADFQKKVWDAKLEATRDKKTGKLKPELVLDEFNRSKVAQQYLNYDPDTGFGTRFKPPRQDVPYGPQLPPAAATGGAMTPDQFQASLGKNPDLSFIPPAVSSFGTTALNALTGAISNPSFTPASTAVPASAITTPSPSGPEYGPAGPGNPGSMYGTPFRIPIPSLPSLPSPVGPGSAFGFMSRPERVSYGALPMPSRTTVYPALPMPRQQEPIYYPPLPMPNQEPIIYPGMPLTEDIPPVYYPPLQIPPRMLGNQGVLGPLTYP